MDIKFLEEELEEAHSLDDVLVLMKREFTALGLDEWIYFFQVIETFKTPPCVCVTSFRPEWLQHYLANSYYFIDPLMTHYALSGLPLSWTVEDDWKEYGPEAVEFQNDLKQWGYRGGMSVPIFTKEGTRGFFNFIVTSHDDKVIEQAAWASYLLRYFHARLIKIWIKVHPGHTSLRARLSTRESEILLAVGDGLTSQEIADKLLLARRTVEAHITAAQAKLNADNRQQALCKAVIHGLIHAERDYREDSITFVL